MPSRISARTPGVLSMISAAMTRPRSFARGSSAWLKTASSVNDSIVWTCACWLAGNTSMMRLQVWTASEVCSVPNVR